VSEVLVHGFSVLEVARRYGIGTGKVRTFIRNGELRAINTALSGKPQWRILAESLEQFEKSRQSQPPPPKRAPRMKRQKGTIDYYPD
jgi:excisionase family DNA binding protein